MPTIIPPKTLPIVHPRTMPLKLPLQLDDSCVLCLMPQQGRRWHDHSRFGNHGIIHGATWTSAGRFGSALSFDGVDDYADAGNDASLDITDAITLEAWVKRQGDHTLWAGIVDKASAYHNRLNSVNERPFLEIITAGGGDALYFTTALPLNRFTHLVMTYNSADNQMKIYREGVLDAQKTHTFGGNIAISPNLVAIGRQSVVTNHFNGLIDEVRIYKRALSAWEIAALYQWGRG